MVKSTVSMAIFNSYVSLPEGRTFGIHGVNLKHSHHVWGLHSDTPGWDGTQLSRHMPGKYTEQGVYYLDVPVSLHDELS